MTQDDKNKMVMAMPFFGEKLYGSFKEYLTEGISIKKTEFGSNNPDFNDLKIKWANVAWIGYFKEKDDIYGVFIKAKDEVIFTKILDYNNTSLSVELTDDRNQYKVFGKVMYVLIQMMKRLKIKKTFFYGMTQKHTDIYNKLWDNKYIQKEADKYGIELQKYEDKFFVSI